MNSNKAVLFLLMFGLSCSAAAQQQGHSGGQQHGGQSAVGDQGQDGNGQMRGGGHGQMKMSRTRHHLARDNGIDAQYASEVSPLVDTDVDMAAAKVLYDSNCASCHGEGGLGDGAAGTALDPAPTNIARFAKKGMARDDYLLWTLSEGGAPVKSAMPAFKNVLTRDEIWQVIAYLRQL